MLLSAAGHSALDVDVAGAVAGAVVAGAPDLAWARAWAPGTAQQLSPVAHDLTG